MKNLPSPGVVLFIAMTAMTLSGGQDRGGKEGMAAGLARSAIVVSSRSPL